MTSRTNVGRAFVTAYLNVRRCIVTVQTRVLVRFGRRGTLFATHFFVTVVLVVRRGRVRIVIAFRGHGSSFQLSLMYELAFVGIEWREQGESVTRSFSQSEECAW